MQFAQMSLLRAPRANGLRERLLIELTCGVHQTLPSECPCWRGKNANCIACTGGSCSVALYGGEAALQGRASQGAEALSAQVQRRCLEGRPEHLRRVTAQGSC